MQVEVLVPSNEINPTLALPVAGDGADVTHISKVDLVLKESLLQEVMGTGAQDSAICDSDQDPVEVLVECGRDPSLRGVDDRADPPMRRAITDPERLKSFLQIGRASCRERGCQYV